MDDFYYAAFCGYRLVPVTALVKTVRAKTHKKKRIDKKWRKRYGYKQVPINEIYVDNVNRNIYGYPVQIDRIVEAMKREGVG